MKGTSETQGASEVRISALPVESADRPNGPSQSLTRAFLWMRDENQRRRAKELLNVLEHSPVGRVRQLYVCPGMSGLQNITIEVSFKKPQNST